MTAEENGLLGNIDDCLIGPVNETLSDAAKLANSEFHNGMPNWELFRAIYAGDTNKISKLRDWSASFSEAYCKDGGIKRAVYTQELAWVAGHDALFLLLHMRPMLPYTVIAKELGVHSETYLRLRDTIRDRMSLSVNSYVLHLHSAYCQVLLYRKKKT